MKRRINSSLLILLLMCSMVFLSSCAKDNMLKDGYYTAHASGYSNGWKEFVTITVSGAKISAVEYNAENESGFIKSWDNAYMKQMKAINGTYPNEYTRNYAAQLVNNQGVDGFDAVSGASTSANSFKQLAIAVIEQAKKGDSQTIIVEIK